MIVNDSEKEEYLRQRLESMQNDIVNVRSSSTATIYAYEWTYRNTSCDVISVITTSTPIKNGAMKDIKVFNKECRR